MSDSGDSGSPNGVFKAIEMLANLKTIAAGGGIIAIIASRAGLLRAVSLALRSKFHVRRPLSVRKADLELIRKKVSSDESYVVVTGPKGVGKTCLVNTFISGRCGVIECKVEPGTMGDAIICQALTAVSNEWLSFFNPLTRAPRTIFFYKLITMGKSPLIVIRASENPQGESEPSAKLTGAARTLAEDFKLRVIIDGSPNALDAGLFVTGRQLIVNIEPMSQHVLWSIPEFQILLADLEAVNLKTALWSVFGGFPLPYRNIQKDEDYKALSAERDREGKLTEAGKQTLQDMIWKIIGDKVGEAVTTVRAARDDHPQMEVILKLLNEHKLQLPCETLTTKKLKRPRPDKVLRQVSLVGDDTLVPANPAIHLVIKHSLVKIPPREDMKKLLMQKNN